MKEIIMDLIIHSGEARSYAMEAIQLAKAGDVAVSYTHLPAKKNTTISVGSKSFNMNAPVKSDFIISGPNPVNADSMNNPPKVLPIVHIQLTFNNEFKKLFSIINFGDVYKRQALYHHFTHG